MTVSNYRPRPLMLIILDGWGHRDEINANAIAAAYKPNWDHIWKEYPHTLISGSGNCVGLPEGQMGNSEVGHLNMGAGRIVHQDFTRIDAAIESGEFFTNKVLNDAIKLAKQTQKSVHVMGLLSPGGVHSHENHMLAFLELAAQQNLTSLFLHAFLDGRDTPPSSAQASLEKLEDRCRQLQCGQVLSLIGRYYAMDRDQRYDRTQKAYDLIVSGKADFHAPTPLEGLMQAYARGETDEFVQATVIGKKEAPGIEMQDGDIVIFMNFRADRARALTQAMTEPNFTGFIRTRWPQLGNFICLTEYDKKFQLPVAFPSQSLDNIFAECISQIGFKQLRIAETEKYAHVTFFFNGGIESPFPGEDRILVPSPKVATYDLHPQMSAYELTDRLTEEVRKQNYDVIICNFANADMVGHSGNFAATVKAIETIDICLGKILQDLLDVGGELLITADHGNAEQMYNSQTNQAHTAHTSEPVPFIYVGREAKICKQDGKLSDIAPTMLYLLGLPKPEEMTGQSLVKLV